MVFAVAATAKEFKVSKGSYAGAQGMGIGLEGGWWGGLNLKMWTTSENALQFNLAYLWAGTIGGGAAYLWHFFDIIEVTDHKFPLYVGIKAGVWAGNSFGLSALVPLGIAWIPKEFPIDVFLQYEPGIAILPSIGPDYMGGTAGIRLWFN